MLVLTRKNGEQIRIGDEITVKVVRIGPNAVRIGIEAPKSVNIAREELAVIEDVNESGDGSEEHF